MNKNLTQYLRYYFIATIEGLNAVRYRTIRVYVDFKNSHILRTETFLSIRIDLA